MANTNLEQADEFNAVPLSELLLSAKGPHRTAMEFCDECDISAPTFSRYVNKKNKRSCPVDMLKKVAEHADPKSGVTLEMLLKANGESSESESFDPASLPSLTTNELVGIVTTSLLIQKYECQYPDENATTDILGLTYQPSWSIETTGVDAVSRKRWDFILWNQLADSGTETERFIRQLLIIIGAVHLGYIRFDKLTFVFSHISLFQKVIERTSQLKLDLCISFLFIDPVNKLIRQEHYIAASQDIPQLRVLSKDSRLPFHTSSLLSSDENNLL